MTILDPLGGPTERTGGRDPDVKAEHRLPEPAVIAVHILEVVDRVAYARSSLRIQRLVHDLCMAAEAVVDVVPIRAERTPRLHHSPPHGRMPALGAFISDPVGLPLSTKERQIP